MSPEERGVTAAYLTYIAVAAVSLIAGWVMPGYAPPWTAFATLGLGLAASGPVGRHVRRVAQEIEDER